MTKCIICERHPAREGGYCVNCASKVKSERKRNQTVKPAHFLTYRGHVVGLFPDGKGKLKARLLRCNADKLPKYKTIDLNHYCEGFTRERIKEFKRCILQLANA